MSGQQTHVVMTSGGVTSWATARRVADKYGTDNLVLLFADTLFEDEDLHRFLADVSRDIGVPITRVCDGRTPEQVDVDRRWLSNQRVAQCSFELKIKPCREWLEANCDPTSTILYLGIDFSEMHRLPAQRAGYAHPIGGCRHRRLCESLFDHEGRLEGPGCPDLLGPEQAWQVEAPLCEPPYVDKEGWYPELRRRGIEPPRLNLLGFAHNNCSARCVRGGQSQWAHLLRVFPDRFAAAEAHEQRMREMLDSDVAYLRDRTGGVTKPLPLTVLRSRIEGQPVGLFDDLDWGGCGCFTEVAA